MVVSTKRDRTLRVLNVEHLHTSMLNMPGESHRGVLTKYGSNRGKSRRDPILSAVISDDYMFRLDLHRTTMLESVKVGPAHTLLWPEMLVE